MILCALFRMAENLARRILRGSPHSGQKMITKDFRCKMTKFKIWTSYMLMKWILKCTFSDMIFLIGYILLRTPYSTLLYTNMISIINLKYFTIKIEIFHNTNTISIINLKYLTIKYFNRPLRVKKPNSLSINTHPRDHTKAFGLLGFYRDSVSNLNFIIIWVR